MTSLNVPVPAGSPLTQRSGRAGVSGEGLAGASGAGGGSDGGFVDSGGCGGGSGPEQDADPGPPRGAGTSRDQSPMAPGEYRCPPPQPEPGQQACPPGLGEEPPPPAVPDGAPGAVPIPSSGLSGAAEPRRAGPRLAAAAPALHGEVTSECLGDEGGLGFGASAARGVDRDYRRLTEPQRPESRDQGLRVVLGR